MKRIVTFGEIMARIATPQFKRFQQAMPGDVEVTFAGAEASIAGSLAYLGSQAAFVTALPKHAIADACIANLRSLGVDTNCILRTDHGRLGIYFYERGVNQRTANVIYDREGSAVSITPAAEYDWDRVLDGAEWFVVSGITPAISRNAADVTLAALQAAARRQVKVACDMNYRSKLWQWDAELSPRALATKTMRQLLPLVDLFVGGREDVAAVLGTDVGEDTDEELLGMCRQISQQYPNIQWVAMTRRFGLSSTENYFGGLLYVVQANVGWFAPQSAVKKHSYLITDIVDRLGAGDAFTAGLLYSLCTTDGAVSAATIEFATAAGCLAHSIEGDFNYVTRAEIESLLAGDSSGRVRR
jgi:2-dehydro-3-deoxygluconokinase